MSERTHGMRRSMIMLVRIVAGLVSAVLVVAAGFGWSADISGTSHALAAAGDVGVVGVTGATMASEAVGAATGQMAPARGDHVTDVPVGRTAAAAVPALGAENILLVGADSRTDAQGHPLTAEQQREIGVPLDGGGVNTDTLLILHIPAGGGAATGVSIPRDTWMGQAVVDAPGVTGPDQDGHQVHYRPAKINSFYGSAKYYDEQYLAARGISGAELQRESDEAGRTMLIKVIQEFTGIKINHYAEVNLLGFYLMSEAIGGVPVCLLHATSDKRSGADFHAGYQSVEGRSALAFVRQRHGVPGGDLGRIKREQAFLDSALDKILSAGTLTDPARLAALVDAAKRSVVLDSGFDLLTFAEQMRGLAAGKVHFVTIPTTVATDIAGTDALQAAPDQVRAIFAALAADRPLPTYTDASSVGSSTVSRTVSSARSAAPSTPVDSRSLSASEGRTTAAARTISASTGTAGYQVPCVN